MIKKIAVAAMIAFAAFAARADFLFWQVENEEGFSLATLKVKDGDGDVVHSFDGVMPYNVEFGGDQFTGTTTGPLPVQTDISAYSSSEYSFFVELVTYNSWDVDASPTSIRNGTEWNYTDLLSSGYVNSGSIAEPEFITKIGGFNMGANIVPEPTSGLLILVGGALLALRRRKRTA